MFYVSWGNAGRSEGDREPLVGCTDGQYINSINSINSINYMNRDVSRGTFGPFGSYRVPGRSRSGGPGGAS